MKTFKIGEYAIGGIIKAGKKDGIYIVSVIDWSSNKQIMQNSSRDILYIQSFLHDVTTDYYTDKIIKHLRHDCES
jgi:hypothetical protein